MKAIGVDFYQDYLLVTNPNSKNPAIKIIINQVEKAFNITLSYDIRPRESSLKGRIVTGYCLAGFHSILSISLSVTPNHDIRSLEWIFYHTFVSIYPILVQLRIRNRIHAILDKKERKENGSIIDRLKRDCKILKDCME